MMSQLRAEGIVRSSQCWKQEANLLKKEQKAVTLAFELTKYLSAATKRKNADAQLTIGAM